MSVKLLTEHHLEFLRLKGGCTGSSESTFVKMPHCWESHATAPLRLSNQVDTVAQRNQLHNFTMILFKVYVYAKHTYRLSLLYFSQLADNKFC